IDFPAVHMKIIEISPQSHQPFLGLFVELVIEEHHVERNRRFQVALVEWLVASHLAQLVVGSKERDYFIPEFFLQSGLDFLFESFSVLGRSFKNDIAACYKG